MEVRNVPIVAFNTVTMKIETGETFLVGPEDTAVFDFWTKVNATNKPTPFYLSICGEGEYRQWRVNYGVPNGNDMGTVYMPVSEVLTYVENYNTKIEDDLYSYGVEDMHPTLLQFISNGGSDYELRMFGRTLFETENQDPISYNGYNTLDKVDADIRKWARNVARALL